MNASIRHDAPESELEASARAAVTIGRSPDDLRALWLDPDTQARIWAHFADVTALDGRTADWVARGPAGGQYRWRTEIIDTGSDQIRWSSLDGADVPNAGTLRFRPAPGDRGTELHLNVRFDPPGGVVGEALSKLFHIVPEEIVGKALYRFRALALSGEIPATEPQPAARKGGSDR
ncbi:SRPBCC family protein [Roseococcus sp. YIM B11640]|uniref:SRPBCC family protein n=1 Tax=Roseococcus sp. YIM B11640 TaxID=3133973 RepID=UPI003C7E0266